MPRHRSYSVRLFAPSSLIVLICWASSLAYYYHLRGLFPFDDTYITFRYAYNLAHGFGLVWNPGGAHTEGYTNFLFVALLAPFSLITKELVPYAQWISILANLVTGIALYHLTFQLSSVRTGKGSLFAGIAVTLLYFLEPYTWYNAFSGMETSLFVMFVVLAFLQLCGALQASERSDQIANIRGAFILSFLALLTRPEGGLLGAICCLVFLLHFKLIRGNVIREIALCFVAPLLLYVLWKLWYFGDVFPNSFYVKVALRESLAANDAMGSNFLPSFYAGVRYLLAFSVIGLFFLRKQRPIILAFLIWICVLTFFYWHSTLLQPFYFRFVYSIEVLLLVLTSLGLYLLARPIRLFGVQWILLGLLLWYHVAHTESKRQAASWVTRDTQFDNRWKELASEFRRIPQHEQMTIAWSDVGILPYFADMKNIDLVGLNTNEISRAKTLLGVRSFLLKSHPEFILMPVDHHIDAGDSCRTVVKWGHGFIGRLYPTLLSDPDFSTYKPVGFIRHEAYDVLLLGNDAVRSANPNLIELFAKPAYALPVPACFR